MDSKSFQAVDDYCKDLRKAPIIAYLAHAYNEEQFRELVEQKQKAGTALAAADIHIIVETLSAKRNIEANVRRAEQSLDDAIRQGMQPYLKNQETKAFWISVGGNVLASFIYSILLIVVFIVAKDQITSWLQSVQPPPSQQQNSQKGETQNAKP